MQDFQAIKNSAEHTKDGVQQKLSALRTPVTEQEDFRSEHPDFDNYIFVVYPRLAAVLYDLSKLPKEEGTFTQLPGVQHDGHDVYVYWNYEAKDEREHWYFGPSSLLDAPGEEPDYPTDEERAAIMARNVKAKFDRNQLEAAALKARWDSNTVNRAELEAHVEDSRRTDATVAARAREQRRAEVLAVKGKRDNKAA